MRKYGTPHCSPMPVLLSPPETDRKSVTTITLEKMHEEWTAPLRSENARLHSFVVRKHVEGTCHGITPRDCIEAIGEDLKVLDGGKLESTLSIRSTDNDGEPQP